MLQIDAELRAFLVEVAALEAKRPRRFGHVALVTLQFRDDGFPLERIDAFGQRAR